MSTVYNGFKQLKYLCEVQRIKSIFEFYINSSIHVALAVYSLVRISEKYYDIPYYEYLDYFIFYGTITGYNFVKYAGIAKFHHRSLTTHLRSIQVFSLFAFVLMVFYAIKLPLKVILAFVPFALLTLLYVVPVFKNFSLNLRNVASLKIMLIAAVWAGVTMFIPVLLINKNIDIHFLLGVFQRFLFVIVLTLPFDIRDLQYDRKQLYTIPQLIGVERTKKLGFILLLLTLFIEFLITPSVHFKTVYLIIFMLLLLLLQRAKRHQSKYYTSFWVEALPIFWWIMLVLVI